MIKYRFCEGYTILLYDGNITHGMTDERLKSHFSLRSSFIQRDGAADPGRCSANCLMLTSTKTQSDISVAH